MSDPQPTWQRSDYTSWVFTGATKEERKSRLERVPEEIRQYVRERVECLFSLGKNDWRLG